MFLCELLVSVELINADDIRKRSWRRLALRLQLDWYSISSGPETAGDVFQMAIAGVAVLDLRWREHPLRLTLAPCNLQSEVWFLLQYTLLKARSTFEDDQGLLVLEAYTDL